MTGALATLYDRHAPWLTLRLARRCADAGMVDEVVQDTFVAVEGRTPLRRPRRGGGVGLGIAIHRLVDHLRKRRPAPVAAAMTAARSPRLASAEDELLLAVEHGDLSGALDGCRPSCAVVQATVLDRLTTREAARLLDIPAGTVKTRMMRARTQLQRR